MSVIGAHRSFCIDRLRQNERSCESVATALHAMSHTVVFLDAPLTMKRQSPILDRDLDVLEVQTGRVSPEISSLSVS